MDVNCDVDDQVACWQCAVYTCPPMQHALPSAWVAMIVSPDLSDVLSLIGIKNSCGFIVVGCRNRPHHGKKGRNSQWRFAALSERSKTKRENKLMSFFWQKKWCNRSHRKPITFRDPAEYTTASLGDSLP